MTRLPLLSSRVEHCLARGFQKASPLQSKKATKHSCMLLGVFHPMKYFRPSLATILSPENDEPPASQSIASWAPLIAPQRCRLSWSFRSKATTALWSNVQRQIFSDHFAFFDFHCFLNIITIFLRDSPCHWSSVERPLPSFLPPFHSIPVLAQAQLRRIRRHRELSSSSSLLLLLFGRVLYTWYLLRPILRKLSWSQKRRLCWD